MYVSNASVSFGLRLRKLVLLTSSFVFSSILWAMHVIPHQVNGSLVFPQSSVRDRIPCTSSFVSRWVCGLMNETICFQNALVEIVVSADDDDDDDTNFF